MPDTFISLMNFNLNWYQEIDDNLNLYYESIHEKYKNEGYQMINHVPPRATGAIIFENSEERAASIFYDEFKYKNAIWINIAFVEKNHRKKGLYKVMHEYLNHVAINLSKNRIYSSIHLQNKLMIDKISKSVGYESLMTIVYKNVNQTIQDH